MSYTGQGGAGVDTYIWNGVTQLWVPGSACANGLTQVLYVDGGTTVPVANQNGSSCFPYGTIQQALDDIGTPVDAADQARQFSVLVTPLVYEEDLVVPPRRQIFLGGVSRNAPILGTAATPRSVSWTQDGGPVTDGPVFAFHMNVTGDITLADGGFDHVVVLGVNGTVAGKIDGTAHVSAASNILVVSGTEIGLILVGSGGGGVAVVGDATELFQIRDTILIGSVDVRACNNVRNTSFLGPVSVALAMATVSAEPRGLYGCNIDGTWTGPADSLRCDGATQYSIEANDVTLAGGATLDRVDDPQIRSVDADLVAASPFTIDTPNRIVYVTTIPAAGGTVRLPSGPGTSPKRDDFCQVKDRTGTASVSPITVDGNGNLIDGLPTAAISTDFGSLTVRFNGAGWSIV